MVDDAFVAYRATVLIGTVDDDRQEVAAIHVSTLGVRPFENAIFQIPSLTHHPMIRRAGDVERAGEYPPREVHIRSLANHICDRITLRAIVAKEQPDREC